MLAMASLESTSFLVHLSSLWFCFLGFSLKTEIILFRFFVIHLHLIVIL